MPEILSRKGFWENTLKIFEMSIHLRKVGFMCKACGFECSADVNAAINIREDCWVAVNQLIVGSCARHDSLASPQLKAGGN
jgi:Putative transposase DNA-binding domain